MKITFLKIYSPEVAAQLPFYRDVLQLPVEKISDFEIRVQLGYSVLVIQEDPEATPYHIAFHIPAAREKAALQWLEERVNILNDGDDKIIRFPAWKAKSLYFYDADKNVLEFISRKDLFPARQEIFSEEMIVGISEIGLATDDVEEKFNFLNSNFGLTKFTGDYNRFCATGDDEGLFIIIDKNEKDWIPAGDKAYASPFEIKLDIQNAIFGASYYNERLNLL